MLSPFDYIILKLNYSNNINSTSISYI